MKGALTEYIDVAQVTLYAFWVFFAGLIFYLRREDKREGYPLQYEDAGRHSGWGFPVPPEEKTYLLRNGHTATLPNHKNDRPDVAIAPIGLWPSFPYVPTGNPMLDGVGPGSYANREDVPELTMDDLPAIVPLRASPSIFVEPSEPDPRGMPVIGADRVTGGVVSEIWVDRAEMLIRYLEVELADGSQNRVLLPMTMALIDRNRRRIHVEAILGSQFKDVPKIANPNQVTKLEEDKIVGYYGGGYLYATPARQEPML
jgi:photosynthetic reaction center H subunit